MNFPCCLLERLQRWSLLAMCFAVGGCGKSPPAVDEADDSPLFAEIAREVGLEFQHFNGATGEYLMPEITGSGLGLLDFDRDGDLDVYLVQGARLIESADAGAKPESGPANRLFRNELIPEGELGFTDVTTETGVGDTGYGMGVAVGDYDNDGFPDLYVTNVGANILYRNLGDGRFRDVTAQAGIGGSEWSTSASFIDYDRDGNLDLVVVNYLAFSLAEQKQCSRPSTGERDYCGPSAYQGTSDRFYRNRGDGTFLDVTAAAGIHTGRAPGLGVTSADFDGNGWPDIYVANDGDANQLWLNRGDGSFEEAGLMSGAAFNAEGAAEASMGVTAGDVDGDGDEDLFMTHLDQETNTLYLNDGSGVFQDVTNIRRLAHLSLGYTGFGAEWLDFDNDGDLDLFTANGAVRINRTGSVGYAERNQLFRNDGNAGFAEIGDAGGPATSLEEVSRGAAFGDIDNDGDVDILVSNNNGPVRLLQNLRGSRRPWLSVELEGKASGRDALGARVAPLWRGRPLSWRRVHRDGSYLSASDPRLHFGFGDRTDIDGVQVLWPSGRKEVWKDVPLGGLIRLEEGTGEGLP